MKALILLIAAIIICPRVLGNSFKVLIATKGVTDSSRKINALENLSSKKRIFVPSGDYIVLLDEFTNVYEFYGEKTILLDTLTGGSSNKLPSIDVGMIYSNRVDIRRPVWNDSNDSILFIFPLPYNFSFNFPQRSELCFFWINIRNPSNKNSYEFVFSDEYGDTIANSLTDTSKYCAQIPGKIKSSLIYKVKKSKSLNFASSEKKISVVRSKGNDVSFDFHSPAVNLIIGIFLEEKRILPAALIYYERAKDQAPMIKEYEDILYNFKTRWKMI